jgi:hypothetical protein
MLELVHRRFIFYPFLLFHDVTVSRFYHLQFGVRLGGNNDDPEAYLCFSVLAKNDAGLIGRKNSPRREGARASALGFSSAALTLQVVITMVQLLNSAKVLVLTLGRSTASPAGGLISQRINN